MSKKEKLAKIKAEGGIPAEEKKELTPEQLEEMEPEDSTKGKPLPQIGETKVEETPKVSSNKNQVVYKLRTGQIRVFSKETHGEDFKEIAERFKNNGKKLVAEEL